MVVGENSQLVPVEQNPGDDVQVICIVRDMTDVSRCHKVSVTLQASTTGAGLIEEVARQYSYEPDSFELIYEGPTSGPLEQVYVSSHRDTALMNLCENCGNGQKNNFTINEKDGSPPKSIPISSSTPGLGLDSLSLGPIAQPTDTPSYTSTSDYTYSSAVLKSETGFVGLVNQAMTCYLNSLLQTLYMTPEFRNALYRWEFDVSSESDPAHSIPYQLQRLFLNLQTSKRRSLETTDVTKSFGWDSSEAWQQHDVQELCRVMFDALETKWKNTDQADLINQLYQGKMKDYVKCLECGNESARVDAFLDIPLVIRPFGSNQAYGSVEEAMEAFVQYETLDGSNQYFCETCNKKCDAHKGLRFSSFPYLLTLQMKRFDFDYTTMHRIKLNDKMTFPEILNLNHLIDKEEDDTKNGSTDSDSKSSTESETSETSTITPDDVAIDALEMDSCASGISSFTANEDDINEKNAKKMTAEGPYEYELFSIMVHSGSAIGGHYYAYIKSFTDGQWYCFNDQHVTKITYDDIRKTYGGGTGRSGYYSASYTSSTNAYMLMYRQIDKNRNADFMQVDSFPDHLRKQIDNLKEAEEEERKQRERDRCMCKIKLFCLHPRETKMLEKRLEVHKDTTLLEATEQAYKMFNLESVLPFSCVRLIKYDDYNGTLERSYEDEEETPMGNLLGGVKSNYMFDLLLELKQRDQEFQVYKPGGVTVKAYLVDLELDDMMAPVNVRAYLTQTNREFKQLISEKLQVPLEHTKIVLERHYSDLRQLTVPNKTLKQDGFDRSNKIFVESSGTEEDVPFQETRFYKLIDRHQNTIRLHVKLPAKYELTLERISNERLARLEAKRTKEKVLGNSDGKQADSNSENQDNEDLDSSAVGCVVSDSKLDSECKFADNTEAPSDGLQSSSRTACRKSDSPGDVELECLNSAEDSARTDSARIGNENADNEWMDTKGIGNEKTDNTGLDNEKADNECMNTTGLDLERIGNEKMINKEIDNNDCVDSLGMDSELKENERADNERADNESVDNEVEGAEEVAFDEMDSAACSNDIGAGGDCGVSGAAGVASADNDEDDMVIGQEASKDWDFHSYNGASGETPVEKEEKYYYKAMPVTESLTGERNVMIYVDKRITLASLKKQLEPEVGTTSDHFKVYRVYSNSQEFESTRLSETLSSYSDDSKIHIKLGRALKKGEYRVKVYQLEINEKEPSKLLFDTIFAKGMTVLEAKVEINKQLKALCDIDIPLDRLRVRKKTWRNPGTIFVNDQRFEDDIPIYANWEVFVETLEAEEVLTSLSQVAIFVRRWRPSKYEMDPFSEIVLHQATTQELKMKLAEISGIEEENVEFAKGRGTFPCDVSLLEIHEDLEWNPNVTSLNAWPLYISDDGHVLYYRDKTEELKELNEAEKKELQQKENSRLLTSASRVTYAPRKERALKIYTDHPADESSCRPSTKVSL